MITIEHHPEKPDKYLLILPAITLVISKEEHQAIIDYDRQKTKLHSPLMGLIIWRIL